MSATPKGSTPKRDVLAPHARDHEHVDWISTQTTIFVLIAIALILYEIQWILPPFVIAGILAQQSSGRASAAACHEMLGGQ